MSTILIEWPHDFVTLCARLPREKGRSRGAGSTAGDTGNL
jgi:hypothetical protein